MPARMPDRPDRTRGEFGSPAPREALDYFRFRGLQIGFDHRDVRPPEHALSFTVARAMETGLLKEIRAALDRAIGEGRTFGQFEEALAPLLKDWGWWGEREMTDPLTGKRVLARLGSPRRLRTLYDANLRAAHAAALWIRAQRTKDTDPYFLYEPGPVGEACEPHRAWAGTLLPVDHPWWDDHFPPNGWGCRCRLHQVSEAEAARRGGPTDPPPRRPVTRWNERTLRFETTDEGLDPAWPTNPGKLWAEGPMGPLRKKFDPADEAFARAAVDSVIDSPILDRFLDQPRGDLAAGIFEQKVRGWLHATTPLVRLPERIMVKQQGRLQSDGHPELMAIDYRRLPALLEAPETVFRPRPLRDDPAGAFDRRLCLMGVVDGQRYFVVVEHDPSATKLELISFYRRSMKPAKIEALLGKARQVLRSPKRRRWDCAW